MAHHRIQLNWADHAENEEGYWIERSTGPGEDFELIASVPANTTSYQDPGLSHSTTYYYRVSAYNIKGDSDYTQVISATTFQPNTETQLPAVWNTGDVGNPSLAGQVDYFGGTFTINGSGEMWKNSDDFHFVYQSFTGDGEIIAQLNSMTAPRDWARAGVMVRETLDQDAKYAMAMSNPGKRQGLQVREIIGDKTHLLGNSNINFPAWLKLTRSGNLFRGYGSEDGMEWNLIHEISIEMEESVYVGLAVSNFNHASQYCTAVFSEVSINDYDMALEAPSGLIAVITSSPGVNLGWLDNSGVEYGFRIERSLNGETGFAEIATVPANTTFYQDDSLSPGTTYYYRVRAFNAIGNSGYSEVSSAQTGGSDPSIIPAPWERMDVGSPSLPGQVEFSSEAFTLEGSGEMWKNSDNFHFVYQSFTGDGEIIAQLNSMTAPRDWARAGVMIRETLDQDAKYAITMSNPGNRYGLQVRETIGNNTSLMGNSSMDFPSWLRLARSGNMFRGYNSADGVEWNLVHEVSIEMAENVYVGLAVSNFNNDSQHCTAVFSDVFVNPVIPAAPVGLSAVATSPNSIGLHWIDNSTDESGFRIERSLGEGISFEEIAVVHKITTSYIDQDLDPLVTYTYRVSAYNVKGNSAYSGTASAETKRTKMIAYLPRLGGDTDQSGFQNIINVTTGPANANDKHLYTGLVGKQVSVELANPLSFQAGTISLKLIPSDLFQTGDLFWSEALTISQQGDEVVVTTNGTSWVSDATLDTITCNHIALRFTDQVMELYVNGQWTSKANGLASNITGFDLGEYNGQLWDVRISDQWLSDEDIHQRSQRCVTGIDSREFSPDPERPQSICGSYICLWASDNKDMSQEKFLYYLYAQEWAYELFTFRAGMYEHGNLEGHLEERRGRDRMIDEAESFIRYTFSNPLEKKDGNTSYWFHENFHSYQSKIPKQRSKWLLEASANWAAWFVFEYPKRGVDKVTFDPQLPMLLHYPGYNRIYHWSILFSYITKFVSDPLFMGRLFNNENEHIIDMKLLEDQLAKEGYDFQDLFVEFAARTAVWDYPDRSISDAFAARDQAAVEAFESQGLEDFNHRFTNVMSAEGTNGELVAIPADLLPGVYAWNTYKIDSTADATYTVRLKGKAANPAGTVFRAMIVKGSGTSYEYFEMPISEVVAFGEGEAQFQVNTVADQELYLVVVSIPSDNLGDIESRYEYTYSFEAAPLATRIGQGNNSRASNEETQAKAPGLAKGKVKFYPNETDGNFVISLMIDPAEPLEINLVNAIGIDVPFTAKRDVNMVEVDFQGPPGLYFLQVKSKHYNEKLKVVKK